jgi:hypothetical protein
MLAAEHQDVIQTGESVLPLSKEQSRLRWSELRALFCEWDPIGVMVDPEWPRDEYDCMVGPVMRLLETGASDAEIADYLRSEITDHFGLSAEHYDCPSVALRTRSWFQSRWATPPIAG